MRTKRNARFIYGIVFLIFFGVAGAIFGRRLYRERQAAEVKYAVQEPGSAGEEKSSEEQTGENPADGSAQLLFNASELSYQGESYRRNTAVKAYLLIGIDREGSLEQEQGYMEEGNADGILVLAYDSANHRVKLLQIPRDSMVPIHITDERHQYTGTEIHQITLAFAYGDGSRRSCEYMEDAVCTLLNGLKMDGYMAVSLEMIRHLNDLIGGVTVEIASDDLIQFDPAFVRGRSVHLEGELAEKFVRARDITKPKTAEERMERQKQYVTAFERQALQEYKKNDRILVELFDSMQEHMITDMSKGEYLRIAMDILLNQEIGTEDFRMLPGEVNTSHFYEEFYTDNEGVNRLVLDTFFRKKA
ncbi:LCP family protein [Oribacterium sp. oral taxon 102]|uniref:LCP family protein n=1 Tax=Oribacterium sp. oral taxon 102 TaxID=671214 RepID=UPI0015BE0E13|nr:LCP family protein [Oribacterium sp. oral taxon 102]NWO20752.1 LCP family protein [Oribacterium sp. oral taxon 102]